MYKQKECKYRGRRRVTKKKKIRKKIKKERKRKRKRKPGRALKKILKGYRRRSSFTHENKILYIRKKKDPKEKYTYLGI